MQGTEKQLSYAADLRTKAIDAINAEVLRRESGIKGTAPADYKKSWNTQEKIDAGISKRIEVNNAINEDIKFLNSVADRVAGYDGDVSRFINICNGIVDECRKMTMRKGGFMAEKLLKMLAK